MFLNNHFLTIIGANMFKRYILILVLSVCLIPSTFAQKTDKMMKTGGYARILSMGGNPYIMDPFYVTANPAWGAFYDHFVFADLGATQGAFQRGGVGQFVSANFRLNPDITLGVLLSRNDFQGVGISRLDLNGIVGSVSGTTGLNNNIEVLGTFNLGSNTAVGLGVAYTGTLNESTPPTGGSTSSSAKQFGVNLGIVSQLTSTIKLDAGASIMMPGATFETPVVNNVQNNQDVSQTIILANARFFWDLTSKWTFVPVVNFLTSSGTQERQDPADPTKLATGDLASQTALLVGLGVNYHVGDFIIAGGPAFAFFKSSQDSDKFSGGKFVNTNTLFPTWNLGLEWNMNEWFVARLGYVATTVKTKNETGATNVTETIATNFPTLFGFQVLNGATVGVGFRLGSFSLDATVNEDVLRQGLNNIGGNGANGATFAYLSASYQLP